MSSSISSSRRPSSVTSAANDNNNNNKDEEPTTTANAILDAATMIPASLKTTLQTQKLESVIKSTRLAVTTNAKVLDTVCSKVDDIDERLTKTEESTAKEFKLVNEKLERAVAKAEFAEKEVTRLAAECITKDDFEKEKKEWERRLSRLEEVNRELLENNKNNNNAASYGYGPLGNFVAKLIEDETKQPLQTLREEITEEWDSAFTALSNDAFKEINDCQSDLRLSEQRTIKLLEESRRHAMQAANDVAVDAAMMLQQSVNHVLKHTQNEIEASGFAVRHEVSSMLFQTKKQVSLLQRAITRLRNTLCLGPDSETIDSVGIMSNSSSAASFQQNNNNVTANNSMMNNNNNNNNNSSAMFMNQSSSSMIPYNNNNQASADFGQNRPERIESDKRKRRRKNHQSEGEEEEDDEESTTSNKSSTENENENENESETDDDEHMSSMLLPKEFLRQQHHPATEKGKNNKAKKKQSKKIVNNGNNDNFMTMMMPQAPVAVSNNNLHNPSASAVDLFSGAQNVSDVDVRSILNTPIFSALRNLIEESARNEIDAHNTLRESQFTTEIEDLRQAIMRKVNLDTVQRLIERGRDRRAAEQLEWCVSSVKELHSSVIKENEWRNLLRSKADFAQLDSVRVECSRRIQGLEEDVQRLERAVVVGFGESLHVAKPGTFAKIEDARVEQDLEKKRLFLERGNIDDTLEVVSSHHDQASLEKELEKMRASGKRVVETGNNRSSSLPDDNRIHVEDARSVVVQSRRDLLHSAPPSRPSKDVVHSSSSLSSSPNHNRNSPSSNSSSTNKLPRSPSRNDNTNSKSISIHHNDDDDDAFVEKDTTVNHQHQMRPHSAVTFSSTTKKTPQRNSNFQSQSSDRNLNNSSPAISNNSNFTVQTTPQANQQHSRQRRHSSSSSSASVATITITSHHHQHHQSGSPLAPPSPSASSSTTGMTMRTPVPPSSSSSSANKKVKREDVLYFGDK